MGWFGGKKAPDCRWTLRDEDALQNLREDDAVKLSEHALQQGLW